MASGKIWTNICPECGRQVDIINGDFEFSMKLHRQSHKSLDYVNAIDRNLNLSTEKMDNSTKLNMNYCHDCKGNFEIINNDLSLSFQLHAQHHKSDNTDSLSDHSSTSNKSKGTKKDQTQPVVTNILDAIFHTMPTGLKAHRGFISEQGCSKAICNLCDITIEPIFRASDHLKTKLHEDNAIAALKSILSSELHDQMEFISFYGSNLCCNLCRSKIDLCSENLHKTAVNIFVHNAGKGHSSKKMTSKDRNQSNETSVILKSLALLNPLINENQNFIDHKMTPHFKCQPCEKQIAYSENQKDMVNNFTSHFSSQGHTKYLSALALLTKWNTLNISGKENHNFIVAKQKIYCTVCAVEVEMNLDQLLTHVRRNSALYGPVQSEFVPGMKAMNVPHVQTPYSYPSNEVNMGSKPEYVTKMQSEFVPGMKVTNLPHVQTPYSFPNKGMNMGCKSEEYASNMSQDKKTQDPSAKFRRLVQTLPLQFRNMITENKKGEAVCTVCKCIIPATTYNVTTHLNGGSHKKKQSELNPTDNVRNSFHPSQTTPNMKGEDVPGQLDKKFESLASSSSYPKKVAEVKTDKSDTLFQELLNKNRGIKMNAKYLIKKSDDIFCNLCNAKILNSYEISLLERNILSHVNGKNHLKKELSNMLDKIQQSSLLVKTNRHFLKKVKNNIVCTSCQCQMPLSDSLDALKHNLEVHFSGSAHKTMLESKTGTTSGPSSSTTPTPETVQSRIQREMAHLAHRTLFCDILGYDEEEYIPLKL